jgi:hypothetical protein
VKSPKFGRIIGWELHPAYLRRRERIDEIASAVNFSAVAEGSPIPDNVSGRLDRHHEPMKDKSMLWMAAFGVALFLFFACPPVRASYSSRRESVLESDSGQTTARSYAPSASAEQFPPRSVRVAPG